ncbi:MAG TPA: SIMPL domain-containing protein [Pyrinomonadaceae bacterium]
MSIDKINEFFRGGSALAIGLIVSSMILSWAYTGSKKSEEAITVTGSAKKRIKSDLVVWNAGASVQGTQLSEAYKQIAEQTPQVKKYLLDKGIPEDQITVSAISTVPLKKQVTYGEEQSSEIVGYELRQEVTVTSNEVDKIAQIARESTELINQGILLRSEAPKFYYTKLGDLKIEMLGEAAKDAKARADRIAESTGSSIGSIRSARMGVMQITAPESTEVSDYGIFDTGTIEKDVTAVVNVSFAVS